MIDGEEVKDLKTLAKIKGVEEMLPKVAKNQISKGEGAKIGEEQYRIIEECLMMDGTIEDACIYAGISVASYYNHRSSNPDFARRMDLARQYPKMVARAAIQRRIRQGDAKTALEFLKLRDKKYKPDTVEEDSNETSRPVVQFISVASNEGAKGGDQSGSDTQNDTKQSSAFDTSVSSGGQEIEETPRENDEQVLRNIDYASSNSD